VDALESNSNAAIDEESTLKYPSTVSLDKFEVGVPVESKWIAPTLDRILKLVASDGGAENGELTETAWPDDDEIRANAGRSGPKSDPDTITAVIEYPRQLESLVNI